MKMATIVLLLHCSTLLVLAEEAETRDLDLDIHGEDIGRKRKHKKRKNQQQLSPCGFGRTFGFGDKFSSQPDYTYINAPVNNYYIGCGSESYAPAQPGYPSINQQQGPGGHGGHGGFGGLGGHGGHGSLGNQGFGGQQIGGSSGYPQQVFNQGQSQNRPVQSVVSAAASSFGSALADYITRPKKAQRQINELLRPFYRLL